MSSVNLNGHTRSQINDYIKSMTNRLPKMEEMKLWGDETPPYADGHR